MPRDGRLDRQRHVDRGAPRRARLRGLLGDEGRRSPTSRKSLALELGPRLIRVNCVAPDVIPTPGIGDGAPGVDTPLPVAGHVDDVAAAARLPRRATCAGFVTGTTIHVDGGNLAAGGWHRAADGRYVTDPTTTPAPHGEERP